MELQFDPTMIGIALLLWPATKSIVLLIAVIANLGSRNPRCHAATERIIEQILGGGEEPKDEV